MNKDLEGQYMTTIDRTFGKKRRLRFAFGKNHPGLMIGIQFYESFDWWHGVFGITFLLWFITIEYRWRVPNCGYPKGDIYTD